MKKIKDKPIVNKDKAAKLLWKVPGGRGEGVAPTRPLMATPSQANARRGANKSKKIKNKSTVNKDIKVA